VLIEKPNAKGEIIIMVRTTKILLTLATMAFAASVYAQDAMKQEGKAKTLATGTFHGKVHSTSGRATIYQEADGKLVLRLTNFKTSNGPDVHVILVATKDADDDANFLKTTKARWSSDGLPWALPVTRSIRAASPRPTLPITS